MIAQQSFQVFRLFCLHFVQYAETAASTVFPFDAHKTPTGELGPTKLLDATCVTTEVYVSPSNPETLSEWFRLT